MAKQTVIVSVLADTNRFTAGMKKVGSTVGSALSGIGKGVVGVGAALTGAVAGLGALALKGGITRALNIEDAKAQLKGLGHETKSIDKIMGSALDSVRGTAFGLGDAAKVAATTVAAGIKPGDELTRTLKLTANAAALAKTGMGEMGSILNKVWTSGRVQTQELNQLADRGIPIWTDLAKHYGVSATELRKMVSQGKVDAATFAQVLEGTVGNSAEAMGDTTRGSFANMMAALSRLGEKAANTFLPHVKDVFKQVTVVLDGLTERFAPIAEKFGGFVTATIAPLLDGSGERILAFFDRFTAGADGLLPQLVGLVRSFTPLGILVKALAPLLPMLVNSFTQVGSVLAAALLPLLPQITPLLDAIAAVVGQLVAAILPPLVAVFGQIVAAVVPLLPPLLALVDQALTAIGPIVTALIPVLTVLAQVIGQVLAAVVPIATAVIAGLSTILGALSPVLVMVAELVGRLVDAVAPIVVQIANLVAQLLPPLIGFLADVAARVVEFAGGLIGWLAPALESVVGFLADLVGGIAGFLGGIGEFFGMAPAEAKTGVSQMSTAIAAGASDIAGQTKAFSSAGGDLADGLNLALVGGVAGTGSDLAQSLATGLADHTKTATAGMTALAGDVTKTADDDLNTSTLKPAGQHLVTGLGAGIDARTPWIKTKVTNLAKSLKRQAEDALEIASPSKVFRRLGQFITQGLGLGILDDQQLAVRALTEVADKIIAVAKTKAAKARAAGAQKLIEAQQDTTLRLWAKGEEQAVALLLAGLTATGKWKSTASKLVKSATLADIAAARDIIASQIQAAQGVLDQLRQAREQLRDQIATSITGAFDLSAGVSGWAGWEAHDFAAMRVNLAGVNAKATRFAGKIKELLAAGVPPQLVQQIAGLGIDKGLSVAAAFLSASKTDQGSFLADWKSLNDVATSIGTSVAGQMYDVGIAAQQGILDGLAANNAQLVKAAENIADTLTKAVKRKLGIKSPSTVMRTLARQTLAGLGLGLGELASIDTAMQRVTAHVEQGYDPTLTMTAAAGRAQTPTDRRPININVYALTPNAEVGRVVVEALREYERTGGLL